MSLAARISRNAPPFRSREHAGKLLARKLRPYTGLNGRDSRVVIVGLPRGGLIVASEVARRLITPLGFIVVRKVAFPSMPEVAAGAVAEGGIRTRSSVAADDLAYEMMVKRTEQELARRIEDFSSFQRPSLRDHNVVIVDDGIATGATVDAAVQSARAQRAASIVVATPVIPDVVFDRLDAEVPVVALEVPAATEFDCVGSYYAQFEQTTDVEVARVLNGTTAKGSLFSLR